MSATEAGDGFDDEVQPVAVRRLLSADIPQLVALSEKVYGELAWTRAQLESHFVRFPYGQVVAYDTATGEVVGNASNLIIRWDDYAFDADDYDLTADGDFTNHDPDRGRTLYGADVCVDPSRRRLGIGKLLYRERRALCRELNLRRIRAGARLRGYGRVRDEVTPEQYVLDVIDKKRRDPTLSFQLGRGSGCWRWCGTTSTATRRAWGTRRSSSG